MTIDKYLVITVTKARYAGFNSKVKIVERMPKLQGNEISLRLKLQIPDAVFERPHLVAEMTVPDTAIPKIDITPEVTDNIEKIIKNATGLTMNISVVEHPELENKEESE